MEKRVTKLAALALVAVMTVGTAVQASATTGNTAPTALTNVDSSIVTASAHRAATPLPEMLGANTIAGFGMINGGVVSSSNALGNFALEVWGSATNNVTPDPYWCNYYWNFNGGTAADSVTLINLPGQGSPVKADTLTVSEDKYGGVSVSVYTRPDVLIGVSASNDVDDDTGYDDQLDTINETYPDYDPELVKYNSTTLDTMITTVYNAASSMQNTGKSYRYDNPTTIAQDYEKYIKGIKGYIKHQIGSNNYKTIAIVSAGSNGSYTIQGPGSSTGTSTNRYVEYTQDVTINLTSAASATVESAQLATVDAIILTGNDALETTVKGDATIMAGNPEIISMNNLETLYGVSMNSVENALGMGYVLARIYDDQASVLNVENVYKYFASKFYHIKSGRLDYIYEKALVENIDDGDVEYSKLFETEASGTYNEAALWGLFNSNAVYYYD